VGKKSKSFKRHQIAKGYVCPYCGGKSQQINSSIVYGSDFGPIYACLPCEAWVGVHKNSNKPLGRLANHELRQLKKAAHEIFDPIWHKIIEDEGELRWKARRRAYVWLSNKSGIPDHLCHIGMMDEDQCKLVIQICQQTTQ